MQPRSLAFTLARMPMWRFAWTAWWSTCRARWAALRARRIAAQELRAMGELECKDLGISRGEVEYLLRAPAEHRLPPHWPS